jgi:ATP-dependent Lon protease
MGKPAVANLSIVFEKFPEGDVCRIDVAASSTGPVFVRVDKNEADLYVRLNNSTRRLNTAEALEYVRSHWRK